MGSAGVLLSTLVVCLAAGALGVPMIYGPSRRIAYIDEGSAAGTPILTLTAYESTSGMTFSGVFELTSASHDYFEVVQSDVTGQVRVKSGLASGDPDREAAPAGVTFRVVVKPDASSAATNTVDVTVLLDDVNDNTPVWPPTNMPPAGGYDIREDASLGIVVHSLTVTDADLGANGEVHYLIEPPSDGTFTVGLLSGIVTLQRSLDYDDAQNHTIRIKAEDGGSSPLSITVEIIVNVIDVLDPAPVFFPSEYAAQISERDYTSANFVVISVLATAFTDPTATITYTLQETTDPLNWFEVRPSSVGNAAEVYAIGDLNIDIAPRYIINIEAVVLDTNGDPKSDLAVATLVITLLDANNNDPIFASGHYFGTVSELANAGFIVIGSVMAFDNDQGTNAEFEYEPLSSSFPFDIDPHSGVITVSGALDYEDSGGKLYEFTIVAKETQTNEKNEGEAAVTIEVINENDNSPMFTDSQYDFTISEDAAGSDILTPICGSTVEASDADENGFGVITYSLAGFGANTVFEVNPSCEIRVAAGAELNRESVNQYHLTLIATDGGSPPLQATTLIAITVLDVNDNPPVFNPTNYTVTLLEHTQHTNFLTLRATDADEPGPNSMITYSVEADPVVADVFSIDSSSGVLSATANLDREISSSYTLTITARDQATVSMSGCAYVNVTVQDNNDVSPMFSPASYSVTIMEDHAVGAAIGATVSATDTEGHAIQYFIDSASAGGVYFSLDRTSGNITLANVVDYENPAERSLSFMVLAIDNAASPRTGNAMVTVNVDNVNDNDPIITNPSDPQLSRTLTENSGTPVPHTVLTVEAGDADGDTITYSLSQNPSTTPPYFSIDGSLGVLHLSQTLDRESDASLVLTIQACDPDARCDSFNIDVTVEDYNDHAPAFSQTSYSETIRECTPGGTAIVTVEAEDNTDVGSNSEVVYSLFSGDTGKFNIEAATGVITLAPAMIDLETEGSTFSVLVRASDNPGGTPSLNAPTDATVTVTVTDCNDRPPIINNTDIEVTIAESRTATTSNMEIHSSITTTDGDIDMVNREVRFELAGDTSPNDWFGVNLSTGAIFIKSGETIDREHSNVNIDSSGRGVLTFDVLAINTPMDRTFTATAMVTVTITDINDNDPMFQEPSGDVTINVVEHSPINSLLLVVSATDEDVGSNAYIEYVITSGDTSLFSIHPTLGAITLIGDLDAEGTTSHTFTVEARNNMTTDGTPDSLTVTVQVTGTNDFNPVFMQPRYDATVQEHNELTGVSPLAAGSTIATVQASDNDTPNTPASNIRYSITGGNEDMIFSVGDTNGAITVERPEMIDFERTAQYDLVVAATDQVTPANQRRQNTTHLVVTVLDVNDRIPMFGDAVYFGTVQEELLSGATVTVTPTIRATDADILNGTESVTIELSSGAPFNPFEINANGSEVRTTQQIDREKDPSFDIMVRARDTGGHESIVILMVTIEDSNDNAPRFTSMAADLNVDVPENYMVGELVQTVEALDDDIGPNAMFTFSLAGDLGFFEIDRRNGQIILVQSLDRELHPEYMLTVTAADTADENSITFTVSITNVNDNDPVFINPPYSGTVDEGVDNGTHTNIFVVAEDLDVDSVVKYRLAAGQSVPFDVDEDSGEIITTGPLDRETTDFYSFMVEAHDTLLGSTIPQAQVQITINDLNDEDPMFTEDTYETDVFEGTPAGVIILQVHADDRDLGTNAEIEYEILSLSVIPANTTGYFVVDSDSGAVSPTREVPNFPSTITLTVVAEDKGPNPRSDTATVVLKLIDRNTNAPQFNPAHYNLTVLENRDNFLLGTVVATETSADLGNNAAIRYSIMPGTGSDKFQIDETTGELRTAASLDREEQDLYTLQLAATDNATDPRTGFAAATIHVLDENDNNPVFDPDYYPIGISENTGIGSTVVRVLVTDRDIGTNAILQYRIANGDTSVFEIDDDGVITTRTALDRERVATYILEVLVNDSGTPMRQDIANVTIFINDENDNSPAFVSASMLNVNVYENATIGHLIGDIEATDPDHQLNGIVAYSFDNGSLSRPPFEIDNNNGRITLAASLDREQENRYELAVIASDQRGTGPNVRSTPGTLIVNVLDVNDNTPQFGQNSFEFTIPENHPTGRMHLIGTLSAMDADEDVNAQVYYHLLDGEEEETECDQLFCIINENGGIYLQTEADRETQDLYVLHVAVSNTPNLTYNASTSVLEDADTAVVTVRLTDLNDSPPQFITDTLTTALAEEAEFGTTITTLRATDGDLGNFSVVWFAIVTPQVPYLVDRDTGVVTTAGVFRGLSGTIQRVTVRAFDNYERAPTLSSTSVMTVHIFKTSEQIILLIDNCNKDQVEDRIDRIESALVEVTESHITITEIRVPQTSGGSVDVTKTEVFFFAFDPETGIVLHPDTVIQLIDERYALVEEAFADCNLISVSTPAPAEDSEDLPAYAWAIIAILAFIILMCCLCFLCLFVAEQRRSKKWKKRNQLSSYQSQLDQFTSGMSEYNPVANPLWVSPYDNWEETSTEPSGSQMDRENPIYESQELTIEMFQDDEDDDLPTSSRENLVKAPPLSHSTPSGQRDSAFSGADEDELLAEAIGEPRRGMHDFDSETSLI